MSPLLQFKVTNKEYFKAIANDLINSNIDFKVYNNFVNLIIVKPAFSKEEVIEDIFKNYPNAEVKKEYSYDHVNWVEV